MPTSNEVLALGVCLHEVADKLSPLWLNDIADRRDIQTMLVEMLSPDLERREECIKLLLEIYEGPCGGVHKLEDTL